MKKTLAAFHADDDAHYRKLGLIRNQVQVWEDGMRTDGSKRTYEWWYFDSSYPDGTKLIIFFYSKSPIQVDSPVKPMSTILVQDINGWAFTKYISILTTSVPQMIELRTATTSLKTVVAV